MTRFFANLILMATLTGALVLFPLSALAQIYPIETIEENNGLPSSDVKALAQDYLGRMWVSTTAGLVFHDGLKWQPAALDSFDLEAGAPLLTGDGEGTVWALFPGESPTLLQLDRDRWSELPLPPTPGHGKRFFGPLEISKQGDTWNAALLEDTDLLHLYFEGRWQTLALEASALGEIHDLDLLGRSLLLATQNGLFTLQLKEGAQPLAHGATLPVGPVLCIDRQTRDRLWLAGPNWLGQLSKSRYQAHLNPQDSDQAGWTEFSPEQCLADAFGGLYLAGEFQLKYFHPDTGLENQGLENGLLDSRARTLFLDREKVVWIGSERGLSKILSRHTAGFTRAQGLLGDEVTALLRRRDGTLVIGHGNGLTLWNGNKKTVSLDDPDLRDRILDLAEDSQGNVWVAGRQRGLGRLSAAGDLRWWPPVHIFPNYYVSVVVDQQDQVWIAASDRLLVFKDNKFTEVNLPVDLPDKTYLRRLILGSDGTLYITTGNAGVMTLKDGQVQRFTTGLKNHGNSVFDILETGGGRIWAGTRDGLYELANGRLVRPRESHLNVARPVYFLETDSQGRLWIGTDNGVLRVEKENVRHFTPENGLIGRETNRCASLPDTEGRFWVGTERGLTLFSDRFEPRHRAAPVLRLLSCEAPGQHINLNTGSEEITLSNSAESLAFHYRVITSWPPLQLQTRSRLKGLESEWVDHDPAALPVRRFSHLTPGAYRFEIQVAAEDGQWGPTLLAPLLHLPAPLWQRPWFLALLVLGGLILLASPLVILAQRRKAADLQAEVDRQLTSKLRMESELETARQKKE